jgi:hypothetical protein
VFEFVSTKKSVEVQYANTIAFVNDFLCSIS